MNYVAIANASMPVCLHNVDVGDRSDSKEFCALCLCAFSKYVAFLALLA